MTGKDAQLWRPMSGEQVAVSYHSENGFTTVPLNLAERESVFIVFEHAAATSSRSEPLPSERTLATLTGEWEVHFPANLGAPPSLHLEKLTSWTENPDAGVKYFSGTATYVKTVQAPASWFRPGQRVELDFGEVRDIAEVEVNGVSAGVVWAPPYRVDISKALHPGMNRLEIKVTNEWTNRQIGDRLLPPEKRILSQPVSRGPAGQGVFGRPQILAESGLLGDVRVLAFASR